MSVAPTCLSLYEFVLAPDSGSVRLRVRVDLDRLNSCGYACLLYSICILIQSHTGEISHISTVRMWRKHVCSADASGALIN